MNALDEKFAYFISVVGIKRINHVSGPKGLVLLKEFLMFLLDVTVNCRIAAILFGAKALIALSIDISGA